MRGSESAASVGAPGGYSLPMRLSALSGLFLAGLAAAQEGTPAPGSSPYAAMGFPVTFNDEVITANDVARFIDQKLEDMDLNTLRRNRDILLFRKINERIAADLSIEVRDSDVDMFVRRKIEELGGDAKFYEWLAQQGTTLERFRIEQRQGYVDSLLNFLLLNGFSLDRMQLLPWRVLPTPKEIETAFRNDPVLKGGMLRARRLRFVIDAPDELRRKLAGQQVVRRITAEEVAAAIEADVQPRVAAALEALKQKPFAEVAVAHGAKNLEAMAKEWVALNGVNETEKFLAEAAVDAWSPPFKLPSGAYEIVLLLERDNPAERKPGDPAVAEEYSRRIKSLRMTKCQALLRLRALDESTVEPERVRDDLRKQILETLAEAEATLNVLGLH